MNEKKSEKEKDKVILRPQKRIDAYTINTKKKKKKTK